MQARGLIAWQLCKFYCVKMRMLTLIAILGLEIDLSLSCSSSFPREIALSARPLAQLHLNP